METIASGNKRITDIIGNQTYYSNAEYRPIKYEKIVEMDDDILLENTMTRQLIRLSRQEYENPDDEIRKFLVENWYLVPPDLSEKSLWYGIRNSYLSKYKKNQNGELIDTFTIFTTLECNARCPYCYEAGRKQTVMTPEIALETAQYIDKVRGSRPVILSWFGGEPLVNSDVMDTICQYMIDNKVPYTSDIISNGYLFDQFSDEDIREKWKIKKVQITLDGTAEEYNQIKGYIDNPEDAFSKVINNAERLAALGVRVNFRLNQSAENYKDLIELAGYLAERFDGSKVISAYAHPLFEDCNNDLTTYEWDEVYNGYIEVDKALKRYGLRSWKKIDAVKTSFCMADSGRHVCISPEGNLTLCEHYSDEEVVGTIWDGITDTALVEQWRELADEKEECEGCWYYPKCLRLKKCNVNNDCDHGALRFWEYQEEESILKIYENYCNQLETEEETVSETFDANLLVEAAKGELGKTLDDRDYWKEAFPKSKQRGWCMPFIYAMFKQAYDSSKLETLLCVKQFPPVPQLLAMHYKRIGRLYDTPEIGDIVFYRARASSHAGIVVSVSGDSTTFDSVEGNVKKDGKSMVCQVKNIPVSGNSYLVGFGRPKWS